jgi:hypothetical protein
MRVIDIEVIGRWGSIAEAGDITQGKLTERKMTKKLLDKYLTASHSPLRRVQIAVTVQASTEPISHLVRHVHSLHYVETGRPDITGEKRSDKERLFLIQASPEEWVNISHDRLCEKAAESTQRLVSMIRYNFEESHDDMLNVLALHMESSCDYLGCCKEVFNGCGKRELKPLKGNYDEKRVDNIKLK